MKKRESIGLFPCEPKEATHVALHFPGPSGIIFLPVLQGPRKRKGTPCWTWNGDTEKPTLKPSIKTTGGDFLCRSWVTDGQVKFLNDCTHDLKGQTVPLLDFGILD